MPGLGAGSDGAEHGAPWQDDAGRNQAGQDYAGQDYAGQDQAGQDYAGQDYAGQDQAGQDYAGPVGGVAPDGDLPWEVRQHLYRQVPFAIPAIAVIPVAVGLLLATTLAPARAGAAALGAAGWLVALALRPPAALAASRLPRMKAPRPMASFMALISGPAEETIRLLLVLFLVKGFDNLLWAGFGWATVEVVYTLVNAVVIRRLLVDPSEKAAEARRALASMGFLQYVQNMVPVLGAIERAAVSLLHIGFTLLLGWNPWLVFVTMPVHSAVNMSAVRLLRRHEVIRLEAIVAAVGAAIFTLGLLAWRL